MIDDLIIDVDIDDWIIGSMIEPLDQCRNHGGDESMIQ
jgi:hypothetical protein